MSNDFIMDEFMSNTSNVSEQKNPIKLLTDHETAALIRKSPAWLRQDRRTERKIPFRKIGRHVRYNEIDVLKFIEQHQLQTAQTKDKSSPKNL